MSGDDEDNIQDLTKVQSGLCSIDEFKIIEKQCKEVVHDYYKNTGLEFTWKIVPFLKYLIDSSCLAEDERCFYQVITNLSIFNSVWNIYLSKSGYIYAKSLNFSDEILHEILNYAQGKFVIGKIKKFWIDTKPYIQSYFSLFGLILFNHSRDFKNSIMICAGEEDNKKVIKIEEVKELNESGLIIIPLKLIGTEILGKKFGVDEYQIIRPFEFTSDFIKYINEKLSCTQISEKIESIGVENSKKLNLLLYEQHSKNKYKPSQKTNKLDSKSKFKIKPSLQSITDDTHILNFINEENLLDENLLILPSKCYHEDCPEDIPLKSQNIEILDKTEISFDTNEKIFEKWPNRTFIGMFTSKNLPDELVIVKKNVELDSDKYFQIIGELRFQNCDWVSILVHYYSNQSSKVVDFDFCNGLDLKWTITVYKNFFEKLFSLGDLIFLHYLFEIIDLAKGNIGGNKEIQHDQSDNQNKKYIEVSISMEKFGLDSITAILYFNTTAKSGKESYLKVIGFTENDKKQHKLEKFETISHNLLEYKKIFKRESIFSMIMIENNEKIIPVKDLIRIRECNKTEVFFFYDFYKKDSLAIVQSKDEKVLKPELKYKDENSKLGLFQVSIEKNLEFKIVLNKNIIYLFNHSSNS